MSRTPGNSDDDPASRPSTESSGPVSAPISIPIALGDSSGPSITISEVEPGSGRAHAIPDELSIPTSGGSVAVWADDPTTSSPAMDSQLFARDAQAGSDAGESARADALICARALLADKQGDEPGALGLWWSAFDRDPSLWVAFWGLRRSLFRRAAWEDLLGVLERRIAAVFAAGTEDVRADLWLERGRIFEDRLGNDDQAAQSYRGGLIEVRDHAGLLISLLFLGWRTNDQAMVGEALAGLLRRPMPDPHRATLAQALARVEAGRTALSGGTVDAAAASRALETLRVALGAVARAHAAPLVNELAGLARAATDPATRVEILEALIAQLPTDAVHDDADLGAAATSGPNKHGQNTDGGGGYVDDSGDTYGDYHESSAAPARRGGDAAPSPEPDPGVAVALLREQARLLRDRLADPVGAGQSLRAALDRAPGHPLVIADLADLAEALARDEGADAAATELRLLLERVAPSNRRLQGDAEIDLAFRTVTALARAGRTTEAVVFLDGHPELHRDRADGRAVDIVLRTAAHDVSGLAAAFERFGEKTAAALSGASVPLGGMGAHASPAAAAHALVVAGTLREREPAAETPGASAGSAPSGDPTQLYWRATEIAPDYRPGWDAVERRLREGARWRDLADLWELRLQQMGRPAAATEQGRVERLRLLEELVALHRDRLDDALTACRYQDEILSFGEADTRAWVRRFDLELALRARGQTSAAPDRRVRILEELAARARAPAIRAGLFLAAARDAAAEGDVASADALFRRALADDPAGAAWAGLERLTPNGRAPRDHNGNDDAGGGAKAAVVRAELAAVVAEAAPSAARIAALRFRIAWHAHAARMPREALEALEPLRRAGDALAWAWSWEIARRGGDAAAQVALLVGMPADRAGAMVDHALDLALAHERAGDMARAEAAFREALRDGASVTASVEAALGLLRVGARRGDAALTLEAMRELVARADPATRPALAEDADMLAFVNAAPPTDGAAAPPAAGASPEADTPSHAVLRWAASVRGPDALAASAGLLALARALPASTRPGATADRNGLLARAAARARLGGAALAGAVHDQVYKLSGGAAPIEVGLADLPIAGRPERAAARAARAERNGGRLASALDIERALDAEARGDSVQALDGFARALARQPDGIEALDGIKRLAYASGDRLGGARAGARLGCVLRAPARAAAELAMSAQTFEDLGMTAEAATAYWQALKRDPASTWIVERLRTVLAARGDDAGLDRLAGIRLASVTDRRGRAALLLERATHRLGQLGDRQGAIEDFKRLLKIEPTQKAALRELATFATQMEYWPQAVRFLERLLLQISDPEAAADLRLELGGAYEAAGHPARAAESLRRAAAARPPDTAPWRRLTDLHLRQGDWSNALEALRGWEKILVDPIAKAEIWVRIGNLLRDHGQSRPTAAAAFVTAAELDPLGEGIHGLVALHDRSGAHGDRRDALDRAIAGLAAQVKADPFDVPRLVRLKDLYALSAATPGSDRAWHGREGGQVVSQLLALWGEATDRIVPRAVLPRGSFGQDVWTRLSVPGGDGFAAHVWASIAGGAAALFPAREPRTGGRERIARDSEPRLAWLEAVAVAIGVPDLELVFPKAGDASDLSVTPLDGDDAVLLIGRGVLAGDAATRFRVGRALSLLRDRAVALDRIAPADIGSLFDAAAAIAGAPRRATADGSGSRRTDDLGKALGKASSRKDRKALEAAAARFATEPLDAAAFRAAVLANADRVGLVLAGDLEAAVRVVGDFDLAAAPAAIAAHPRARALIDFALEEDYLELRRTFDGVEG